MHTLSFAAVASGLGPVARLLSVTGPSASWLPLATLSTTAPEAFPSCPEAFPPCLLCPF